MRLKFALSTAARTNNNTLTFYTDSFLARNSDDPFHPVMGSVWYNTETGLSDTHRVKGYASSMNLKAKAVLLALEVCPSNTTVHIHTDSQSTHNVAAKIASGQYWDIPT